MATIKLTIEYDGTAYAGWQRQPRHQTIQAVLEEALFKVTQEHIPIIGAGRTDAGVHALGQVASFQADKPLTSSQWGPALNSYLPQDISVISSEIVPDNFHARYSAQGKIYEYHITMQAARPALYRHRTWHFPHHLDIDAIHRAIPYFFGTHDFSSFRGQRSQTVNPICTISQCALQVKSTSVYIKVEGDRFLKQMIRAMVGTLVEIGLQKRSPDTIQEILAAKDRRAAGRTAPPHGLYLTKVKY